MSPSQVVGGVSAHRRTGTRRPDRRRIWRASQRPGRHTVAIDIFLETERLTLRRLTESDVDNLVALDGDPAVMRYLTGRPTPREVVENEILPWILRLYDTFGGLGLWAAIERSTGDFLGWFELRPNDGDVTDLELGYRLRRSAWGRGFATEGSRALLAKAFTDLGARRVFAHTMAVNTPSRRVMERIGLRHARTFHPHFDDPLPGTEHGEVEYELLRSDWLSTPPDLASPT
jgi:RimJ/RimL family protein N-acetyltransferase